MTPEFLLTSLIVVLAPGTGVIYTLAVALTRGRAASVAAAFGCTLGITPHIAAAILGVAALLHTSALVFQLFKYAGVAYLLYLAWQTLRDGGTLAIDQARQAGGMTSIAVTGFLINILNPKLSIFFLAFLPQFVDPAKTSPLSDMLLLSALFMIMTFVVFIAYGVIASVARTRLLGSRTAMAWLRRSFAAAFVLLGARLALSER